jgi:hypothetical protein
MCNLDSGSFDVYLGFNLIEACAAAILTPYLNAARACVFGVLPVSSPDQDW